MHNVFLGVYIAETAQASMRHILGPCQTVAACLGFLFGYTSGVYASWRTCKLILGTVITLPASIAVLLCKETPHWLVKKDMLHEARYNIS